MEEWKTYRYTELCTLIGGGTPKTTIPEYWDGNIPWLSVKDFGGGEKYVYTTEKSITELGLNNSSTKLLEKDDVIISARGTVGEIAMIPFPMAFNQSCFGIRAKRDLIDPHYLYYLTKTKVAELKKASHGSVFDTITRDTFDGISCELPDLNTQKRISTLLSSIDLKIELNTRINHNLEEQAQALYKSWFVDFEPFKGGKFIQSRVGLIPETWAIQRICDLPLYISDYVSNGSFASLKENVTLYETPNYAQFIRNTDLKCRQFSVWVDHKSYEYLAKSKLEGGEIIISNVGDVGSVHICPQLNTPMTLGNNVIMIKPLDNIYKYFIYMTFKWFHGKDLINGITGGSAMPKFNKTDFKSLNLLIPDYSTLCKFNSLVSNLFENTISLNSSNQRLSEIRDTLLPKLMSGELKINDLTC